MSAWFVFLVAAITCIATLSAVAYGQAEAGRAVTSSLGGITTITYTLWDLNRMPRLEACPKPFEKQNPGITDQEMNRPTWNPGYGSNPFGTRFASYEATVQGQQQNYHLTRQDFFNEANTKGAILGYVKSRADKITSIMQAALEAVCTRQESAPAVGSGAN